MRQSILLPAVLLFVIPAATTQAQNTQRGATFGGLAGAIAGGLIGDHNGEAGAGALIGGAVGAVAGGVIGNARDKEIAYQQSQMAYQAQQQQYAAAAAAQQAVSINDVIQMSRSGLSETVLTNQIMQRGVQRRLEVADIILMHQNGVSENVISAMQRATVGPPAAAPAPAPAPVAPVAPVYVERHYEVVPTYIVPAPRYHHYRYHDHHHHHHRRHHGSHWDVSIGF
ncbi:glycine zipper domain-containing protein [Candidatus Laterigemmans baculatus]|uniref:glycine zipper domain-containing protein n=1 Tax=Candidatus Laterigemmans baculatus TaxID=2770505 RepID=UPI0013DC2149|nr:glycine zipper domain-containing protein [Candidatus Laterigemmans baculatus]